MKRKYFLILAALFCVAAYGQDTFAPVGAEWYYNYNFNPNGYYYRIDSEKDTVVAESNCRVLKRYNDTSISVASNEYIIEQEDGKVYYYYQDRFNLLFDFDAQVNDTVEFTFMYRRYDDEFYISYKDTIISLRYEVESITTNEQNMRTFMLNILDDDIDKVRFSYWTYSYTEKVGDATQFMPKLDNLSVISPIDEFLELRCYSDADLSYISPYWITYGGHGYYPCDYSLVNGIDQTKIDSDIPYITDGVLFWKNPEKLSVKINLYSLNGAQISEVYPVTDEYSLKNSVSTPILYEIIIGNKRYVGKYIFN